VERIRGQKWCKGTKPLLQATGAGKGIYKGKQMESQTELLARVVKRWRQWLVVAEAEGFAAYAEFAIPAAITARRCH
jgi:hypothetical protein